MASDSEKKPKGKASKGKGAYVRIFEAIFFDLYVEGATEFVFDRERIPRIAQQLGLETPKNLGDLIYSFRYRTEYPEKVRATAPPGKQWIIRGAGTSAYKIQLMNEFVLSPGVGQIVRKVPDATPQIILRNARGDEQALLARVRYNRLLDLFLQVNAYSLQSHLRTAVENVGQIEIDELYLGVDRSGIQYTIPVQAKGGKDRHSMVQTFQDIEYCEARYPEMVCRPVSAQFIENDRIALFELLPCEDGLGIAREAHYKLASAESITRADIDTYRRSLIE